MESVYQYQFTYTHNLIQHTWRVLSLHCCHYHPYHHHHHPYLQSDSGRTGAEINKTKTQNAAHNINDDWVTVEETIARALEGCMKDGTFNKGHGDLWKQIPLALLTEWVAVTAITDYKINLLITTFLKSLREYPYSLVIIFMSTCMERKSVDCTLYLIGLLWEIAEMKGCIQKNLHWLAYHPGPGPLSGPFLDHS